MKPLMPVLVLLMIMQNAVQNADGLGVVSDFLENDTMEIMEGDYKIYSIRVQNPGNDRARVGISYDGNFMKIIGDDEFFIEPKSKQSVLFNISAGKSGNYDIGYTVHELSATEGIPLQLKINKNFRLRVIDNPEKSGLGPEFGSFIPAGILILAILLYLFRNKK